MSYVTVVWCPPSKDLTATDYFFLLLLFLLISILFRLVCGILRLNWGIISFLFGFLFSIAAANYLAKKKFLTAKVFLLPILCKILQDRRCSS